MGRHRVSSSVSLMRLATLLWVVLCSSASPLEPKPQTTHALPHEAESSVISSDFLQARADVKPFTLRIMPLGASITAGFGTTFEQGYRKPLRDQLRWRGWPVNMIGSLRGTSEVNFKNDQHEGHKGHVVAQTIDDSNLSLYRKPNLILINCGTNDAAGVMGANVPTTGDRMKLVLDHLYKEVDNVTIILSTLVPRLDASAANASSISAQYRTLASNYAAAGRKIILAELGNGFLDSSTDYYDGIHPNDQGAAKVAAVWDQAILEAEDKNFITEPIDTGIPDVSIGTDTGGQGTCAVIRGALRGPVKTQSGWGYNDGTYAHKENGNTFSIDLGSTLIYDIERGTGGIWFAQLVNAGNADFGDYLDELVYCTDTGPGQVPGPCTMWENSNGYYNKIKATRLDIGLNCLARGIRFGDVNGDGLDDAICINQEAKMYVAINKGGNPPTFEVLANGGLVRGVGTEQTCDSQAQVRLGDMDGDGRLDYCCIDGKGDIYCWRNGGAGKAPTAEENGYWQQLVGGITFKAKGEGEGIDGVRFVDINGDGRTDWVYVHKDGSSDIYVNQRGSYSEDGKGLAPHWAKASSTHAAIDGLDTRDNIYFGRLEPRSYRGDNLPTRADRIIVQNLTATAGKNDPKVQLVFQANLGAGGTKLKGDGVFYCDMFGSGSDDYLWVLSTGAITLFKNIHSPPQWGPLGQIIDIKRDRKSIHFGDWDGDGKCDILAVERHTGRVEWWRNLYKTGDKVPTFAAPEWAVDSYDHLCTEGWGNGVYDYGLEFADLDGDKRVDYLCMKKNMQVFGSLNKAGGLQYKDQIKLAPDEGKLDRANFKWADVNGDGKADLIWVDKFDGKGRLWTNGGFTPAAGSSMTWNYEGFRFDGHGRGQNIHFPKIGTSGRADYHDVWPDTAISNTWFNECSRDGEGQDDYPEPIDPDLPTPPDAGQTGGGIPADKLQRAKDTYKGIYWDMAAETCTPEEFDTLVEATRQAVIVMDVDNFDRQPTRTPGWNEFFVSSFDWEPPDGKYQKTYTYMNKLFTDLGHFLEEGPRSGRNAMQYLVSYRCRDAKPYKECAQRSSVGAYYSRYGCNDNFLCKRITFCNRFFRRNPGLPQPRHIADIINDGGYRSPDTFANLESFERTVIYEWSHAKGWVHGDAIIDVNDYATSESTVKQIIYGSYLAHAYAWKFTTPTRPNEPNPTTASNADNYALMYTWNAYAKAYGWNSAVVDDADWQNGTDVLDYPQGFTEDVGSTQTGFDTNLESGSSCRFSNDSQGYSIVECDYLGGDFYAVSGCYLTIDCTIPLIDGGINPDCTCTCDGKEVDNKDPRCADPMRDPLI